MSRHFSKDILMSNVYEKMLNVTIYQSNKFKSKPAVRKPHTCLDNTSLKKQKISTINDNVVKWNLLMGKQMM